LLQPATENIEVFISSHPEHLLADDELCPPRHP
jgi:hypothetical protein